MLTGGSGPAGSSPLWPAVGVSLVAHAALLGGAMTWNPWSARHHSPAPIELQVITQPSRSAAAQMAIHRPASRGDLVTQRPPVDAVAAPTRLLDPLEDLRCRAPHASHVPPRPCDVAPHRLLAAVDRQPVPIRRDDVETDDIEPASPPPRRAVTPRSTPSTGDPVVAEPGADQRFLPKQRPSAPPIYPTEALHAGWEGRVEVVAVLNRAGRVVRVRIYRSSGHDALDQSALEWVRQLTFDVQPLWFARRAERAIRVPVRFDIVE